VSGLEQDCCVAENPAFNAVSPASGPVESPVVRALRGNLLFAIGSSLLGVAITLSLPPYYPLVQPDSAGYIAFDHSRTSFYPLFLRILLRSGLNLHQVTYVQLTIFYVCVLFLLLAMLRAGCKRFLVLILVIALATNIGFSSYYSTIMTESLFFSLSAIMVALLVDYLRTGRVVFIAAASLFVGLLYGIRPAAITLMPMLFVAAWLKWRARNCRAWLLAAALVGSLSVGPILESVVFSAEHRDDRASIVPNLLSGKAAMLMERNTEFSGPSAGTLNRLSAELYATYAPVHKFLSNIPSIVAWPVVSSTYEAVAQFSILDNALAKASRRTGLSQDWLREQLGLRAIKHNIGGYLRLSLLNYFGQWSVTALNFPPAARAFNEYVDRYPDVPFREKISLIILHPPASIKSYVIYPAFLGAGLVSLLLGIGVVVFLWKPELADRPRLHYLMLAGFFSAMCQVHTIVVSLVNVATPRFLMAVYPQLILVFIFLVVATFPRLTTSGRAYERRTA
jgi:hypothetical protein